jgi:hypothetical protein
VVPNDCIFNICIESHVGIVDCIGYVLGQIGVKDIGMLANGCEDIFNSEMDVVDVNDRDQGTKVAMRAPIIEPKGGVACACTPSIPGFENFFGSNYRKPRW